ncbi:hypothetical protein [uncultured Fibrobacter sp.]|uniref:hypothetical protein n=1 Tax=uncultured Fibrobacter sp. TaxID=261512 RepID=UPI0025CC4FC2|nr:hypothetical protein [uncultured Fibrobacter sp.]
MEKIIGGVDFDAATPMRISHKILWPCYEFVASAEGLDGYAKNIIEDTILRLVEIKITSEDELASCMGLEKDLVSFVLSRLEQQDYIDSCRRITDEGAKRLTESSEIQYTDIHVYVDAISGRLLPYFNVIGSDRYFKYSDGKEKYDETSGVEMFEYKGYSTAGKEKEEKQKAYKLHYEESFNVVPDRHTVTAMLHRLHPGKDSVYAQIDESQMAKRNLRWFLIDVMQPEGSSRDWVFSDGFGKISTFFTASQIKNEIDRKYIVNLRERLQIQTNALNTATLSSEGRFPKLKEKIDLVEKSMRELQMSVDSPDRAEMLFSAVADSVLYLTQLSEWVLFYLLHKDNVAADAMNFFDTMENNSDAPYCVGSLAFRCAKSMGFDLITKERDAFCQKPSRVANAYHHLPSLLPLLPLFLITFEKESLFKGFAAKYPDFLHMILFLNLKRGRSFHSGKLEDELRKVKECVEKVHEQIYYLINDALGVMVKEKHGLSFLEKISLQNERDEAIGRMEEELGFALCNTLDTSLIRFVTDMERRGIDAETLNNALVIDLYRILEYLFVSANNRLGNALRNSDWQKKVVAAGLAFSEKRNDSDFAALVKTREYMVGAALARKPSSMNAACIAFCTLAEKALLQKIAQRWGTMLGDISYIVKKRGHGEIPEKVDSARVFEIKKHVVDIIHFFAEEGFLV